MGRESYFRHQFNEYMFELERGEVDDFSLTLPLDQQIAFYIYSYTNKEGVYALTEEIGSDIPPEVTVVENVHRTIVR